MANGVGVEGITATPRGCCCLLLLLILLSPLPLFPVRGGGHGDGNGDGRSEPEVVEGSQEPTLVERAIGFTGFHNRWDAVKAWSKLTWMNLRHPNSWYGRSNSNAGEVIREAATKSFEDSKETVEHAAESAAKVAGEAVQKTKEKVQRSVSTSNGDPDAEL